MFFTKFWIAVGIAITIFLTTLFVVKQHMLYAATSVVGMFAFTNLLRSIAFKERGMNSEAKLMKILTYVSIGLCLLLLIVSLFTRG